MALIGNTLIHQARSTLGRLWVDYGLTRKAYNVWSTNDYSILLEMSFTYKDNIRESLVITSLITEIGTHNTREITHTFHNIPTPSELESLAFKAMGNTNILRGVLKAV